MKSEWVERSSRNRMKICCKDYTTTKLQRINTTRYADYVKVTMLSTKDNQILNFNEPKRNQSTKSAQCFAIWTLTSSSKCICFQVLFAYACPFFFVYSSKFWECILAVDTGNLQADEGKSRGGQSWPEV